MRSGRLNLLKNLAYSHETHSYAKLLPNLDLSLEVTDDIIARFSYSKTMTRPNLQAMRATTSLTAQPKVGSRTGFAGNPQLDPYSSDNLDLSVEYYYGDASYVSIGWFNKDVENFLQDNVQTETYDQLRDPHQGLAAKSGSFGTDFTEYNSYG